jgi:hypothetical protein
MQEMLRMVLRKLNKQEEAIQTYQKNDKHWRQLYSHLKLCQKDIEEPRIKIIPKKKLKANTYQRLLIYSQILKYQR